MQPPLTTTHQEETSVGATPSGNKKRPSPVSPLLRVVALTIRKFSSLWHRLGRKMLSKGIQVYTYIAVPGCKVELSVPKHTVVKEELNVFANDDLQLQLKNLPGILTTTGRFSFKVTHNGSQITEQWVDVNALSGGVEGGTLNTIANTPSVFSGDIIVTYGFYRAGHGEEGLPDHHQCYVYVIPNYGNWMGSVAPVGSPQVEKPFASLVLPAAHDIGMNSMKTCDALLQHAGAAVVTTLLSNNAVLEKIADKVSSAAVMSLAPNIIASLAITQKDSVDAVLQIGARYFEFRPAHLHKAVLPVSPLPDKLYFQHGAIPGMPYDEFLHDVVQFLLAHPTEIIVVQLRWDGVPAECARPSDQELSDYLNTALALSKGSLKAGNLDDFLHANIAQLRNDRKRLIICSNVDSLSTYTDAANATLNGDSILAEYQTVLKPENESGKPFINIQCQATASNITGVVVYSVLSADASTSCLLSTKAICDSKTLPWIRSNAMRDCRPEEPLIVMNDFFDGATADVSVALSRERLH